MPRKSKINTWDRRVLIRWIDFRETKGLSYGQAARDLGVSREYLYLVENNQKPPSKKLLLNMAYMLVARTKWNVEPID